MSNLTEVQIMAIEAMFRHMSARHFSICDIDTVGEIVGVKPQGVDYQTLRAIHCVDFKDMPPLLRNSIPNLVFSALGEALPFDVCQALAPPPPARPDIELLRPSSEPLLIAAAPKSRWPWKRNGHE